MLRLRPLQAPARGVCIVVQLIVTLCSRRPLRSPPCSCGDEAVLCLPPVLAALQVAVATSERPHVGRRLERQLKGGLLRAAAVAFIRPADRRPVTRFPDGSPVRNARAILVVRQDNRLGNLVLLVPFLRALRSVAPRARIEVVVGDRFARVLEGQDLADAFIVERKRWLIRNPWAYPRFLRAVRRRRWDVAFDLGNPDTHSFSNALLTAVSGARVRVGFEHPRTHRVINAPVRLPRTEIHYSRVFLALLSALGENPHPEEMRLAPEGLLAPATAPPGPIHPIVVHVGGRGEKRWPAECFARVIAELPAAWRERVLVIGGPADEVPLASVAGAVPDVKAVQLRCLTDLAERLQNAGAYVGCDAGPLHLAAAFGIPCVSLFLTSHPLRYAPLGTHHVTLLLGAGSRAWAARSRIEPLDGTAASRRAAQLQWDMHFAAQLAAVKPIMRAIPEGAVADEEVAAVVCAIQEILGAPGKGKEPAV